MSSTDVSISLAYILTYSFYEKHLHNQYILKIGIKKALLKCPLINIAQKSKEPKSNDEAKRKGSYNVIQP